MNLKEAKESEARFEAYIAELASAMGHKDREEPLRDYSRGLLTATGRKSVEPLATAVAPAKVAAKHQSLLHFVGQSEWSDTAVLTKVRKHVQLDNPSPIGEARAEAWLESDWGKPLPKLYEQVFFQQGGFAMIMLWAELADEEESDDWGEMTSKQRLQERQAKWGS